MRRDGNRQPASGGGACYIGGRIIVERMTAVKYAAKALSMTSMTKVVTSTPAVMNGQRHRSAKFLLKRSTWNTAGLSYGVITIFGCSFYFLAERSQI